MEILLAISALIPEQHPFSALRYKLFLLLKRFVNSVKQHLCFPSPAYSPNKNDSFCLIASITPCAAKFWPVDNVPFHCNKFEFFSLFLSAIPRTSTAHSLTLPIVIHFRQYAHTLLHLLHKTTQIAADLHFRSVGTYI